MRSRTWSSARVPALRFCCGVDRRSKPIDVPVPIVRSKLLCAPVRGALSGLYNTKTVRSESREGSEGSVERDSSCRGTRDDDVADETIERRPKISDFHGRTMETYLIAAGTRELVKCYVRAAYDGLAVADEWLVTPPKRTNHVERETYVSVMSTRIGRESIIMACAS